MEWALDDKGSSSQEEKIASQIKEKDKSNTWPNLHGSEQLGEGLNRVSKILIVRNSNTLE